MKKDLPIQNVSFRENIDRFLTEGGGSKALPKWVNEENITKNVIVVSQQLKSFEGLFYKEPRVLPVLVEVVLHEKATAKSHRPAIRSILYVNNKRNVLGVSSVGRIIAKIDSREDLNKIECRYSIRDTKQLTKSSKVGLSAINSINHLKVSVDQDITEKDTLKIQLVDYLSNDLNNCSKQLLQNKCQDFGIEVKELNYASSLRLFLISKVSKEALEAIATMDSVLAVRKMPTIEFEAAPEPINSKLELMKPLDTESYPVIGLLDTGVGNIDYLKPWEYGEEDNCVNLQEMEIDRRHGTAVAGVINYGDMLEGENYTECGPCKIQSCIVNTSRDRSLVLEHELVQYIQQALALHPEIKIWNLSQGTNKIIKDDSYSDFAIALDSLQKNNNILICKSAGNIEFQDQSNRITDGAESLLSLVVGSIAHKKGTPNDVEKNHRSSFSRIGPGVDNVVKPDLVHYGGNNDTHMQLLSEYGVQYLRWSGTSFSTPRITSLAANLQQRIGGDCNPLLLKALLVHNSDYPCEVNESKECLRKEMGFGIPSAVTNMLKDDADECTMVFKQTLEKGKDIASLDFPYPECLKKNGKFIGKIKLTMVTNPIINASQGCEYCQSQVDVLLETFDQVIHVNLGEGIMRNADRTSDDAVNVLNPNLYSKKSFKPEMAEERMLIEQGDKYQPIKKYVIDLDKMTPRNKEKALRDNRKWALKLKGLYRDAAEMSLKRDGEVLSQEIIVVITITDPLHQGIVYSQCMELLDQRGYVHNNIEVNNVIQLNNSNI